MEIVKPLKNLVRIVRFHGGLWRTMVHIYLTDTEKIGHLVGEDEFGNRYYENRYYFFGSDRWVVYSRKAGLDYDASQVSCAYFNWLHNITDILPCCDPSRPEYCWKLPHTENPTGTCLQYVPYSTTKPKIQAWQPKASRTDCRTLCQ